MARILRECGLEADTNQPLPLTRGSVNVDVYARDGSTTPPSTIIIECKLWKKRVPKQAVHSLRTVVADAGANLGLLVSMAGAQRGAVEATEHTNVQLVDWTHFQELFVRRWYQNFFVPTLRIEADPLLEYTEPMNSRILRRSGGLSDGGLEEFRALRDRHVDLAFGLDLLWFTPSGEVPQAPDLPLRSTYATNESIRLPDDVLDAESLRELREALIGHYRAAIREFDSVFGGRA